MNCHVKLISTICSTEKCKWNVFLSAWQLFPCPLYYDTCRTDPCGCARYPRTARVGWSASHENDVLGVGCRVDSCMQYLGRIKTFPFNDIFHKNYIRLSLNKFIRQNWYVILIRVKLVLVSTLETYEYISLTHCRHCTVFHPEIFAPLYIVLSNWKSD